MIGTYVHLGARKLAGLAAAMAAACAMCVPTPAAAQKLDRRRAAAVRENLVFHFAGMVTWPSSSFASETDELRVCFLGDGLGDVVTLARKRAALVRAGKQPRPHGRRIEIESIPESTVARGDAAASSVAERCHILYVDDDVDGGARFVRALEGKPVLTIGDGADFARNTGVLAFAVREGHYRIHANVRRARRAKLRLGARVLQHATLVGGRR